MRDGADHTRILENAARSEEHTSELQSQSNLVCRLLLEKKKKKEFNTNTQVVTRCLFKVLYSRPLDDMHLAFPIDLRVATVTAVVTIQQDLAPLLNCADV